MLFLLVFMEWNALSSFTLFLHHPQCNAPNALNSLLLRAFVMAGHGHEPIVLLTKFFFRVMSHQLLLMKMQRFPTTSHLLVTLGPLASKEHALFFLLSRAADVKQAAGMCHVPPPLHTQPSPQHEMGSICLERESKACQVPGQHTCSRWDPLSASLLQEQEQYRSS